MLTKQYPPVPAWLHACDDNIIQLLYALDVANSDGKIASDMLFALFKGIPYQELVQNFQYIDENMQIPFVKLTAETAAYWRNLTKFLYTEGGGAIESMEKLIPELSDFCHYVRQYIIVMDKPEDDLAWSFVARQLIEMTSIFDLADEVTFTDFLSVSLLSIPQLHSSLDGTIWEGSART